MDFLKEQPKKWDLIVTNPPFSSPLKDDFLERAYCLGKPFAMLFSPDVLAGRRRGAMWRQHGLELMVPDKRIDFIVNGEQTHAANFPTIWFCWKLLPSPLMFYETNW